MKGLQMNNKNWNRLGFFILGTFLGGWVLGLIGGLVGGVTGRR